MSITAHPTPPTSLERPEQIAWLRDAFVVGIRTERICTLGVGCEQAGVCYAAAHGQPDQCGVE